MYLHDAVLDNCQLAVHRADLILHAPFEFPELAAQIGGGRVVAHGALDCPLLVVVPLQMGACAQFPLHGTKRRSEETCPGHCVSV